MRSFVLIWITSVSLLNVGCSLRVPGSGRAFDFGTSAVISVVSLDAAPRTLCNCFR